MSSRDMRGIGEKPTPGSWDVTERNDDGVSNHDVRARRFLGLIKREVEHGWAYGVLGAVVLVVVGIAGYETSKQGELTASIGDAVGRVGVSSEVAGGADFFVKTPGYESRELPGVVELAYVEGGQEFVLDESSFDQDGEEVGYVIREEGVNDLAIIQSVGELEVIQREIDFLSESDRLKWVDGQAVWAGTEPLVQVFFGGGLEFELEEVDFSDVHSWSVSPDGEMLVVVRDNGDVELVDLFRGDSRLWYEGRGVVDYFSPEWVSDSQVMMFRSRVDGELPKGVEDLSLRYVEAVIAEVDLPKLSGARMLGSTYIQGERVQDVVVSLDGRYAAMADSGVVFDLNGATVVRSSRAEVGRRVYRWSDDGVLLESLQVERLGGGADSVVTVIDVGGGEDELIHVSGASGAVEADWLGDDVVFTYGGAVWVMGVDGTSLERFELPFREYGQLVVSEDGDRVLVAGDDVLLVLLLRVDDLDRIPVSFEERRVDADRVDELRSL